MSPTKILVPDQRRLSVAKRSLSVNVICRERYALVLTVGREPLSVFLTLDRFWRHWLDDQSHGLILQLILMFHGLEKGFQEEQREENPHHVEIEDFR